jgi:hypothetical protein
MHIIFARCSLQSAHLDKCSPRDLKSLHLPFLPLQIHGEILDTNNMSGSNGWSAGLHSPNSISLQREGSVESRESVGRHQLCVPVTSQSYNVGLQLPWPSPNPVVPVVRCENILVIGCLLKYSSMIPEGSEPPWSSCQGKTVPPWQWKTCFLAWRSLGLFCSPETLMEPFREDTSVTSQGLNPTCVFLLKPLDLWQRM